MLFNSIDFAIFLPIVFLLYWFVTNSNLKLQNALIVGASYLFYGWWDWRFLSLIIFSTVVDYLVGCALQKQQNQLKRKLLLWISISINLGFLGLFKYYNFFLDNFSIAFSFFGKEINPHSLHLILPVGISFYTFQTLSYSIDVFNRKLQPTKDFIAFSAFVCFFPQLVAGPIERAANLLPQFHQKRRFEYSKTIDGLRQILWGLFKKIVIADNCATYANLIFNNAANYSGSTLVIGALFFTFQIYCDFSGYSDIAIGTSRLFGFNLQRNFNFPYFSRDIAEFWRRWHISLSTWFRDYVYIPLGGGRGSTWSKVRNTFLVFILCGFWHGANWTFIMWGFINALYMMPGIIFNKQRKKLDCVANNRYLPTFKEFFAITTTFSLTALSWIFFRATSVTAAFSYLSKIVSLSFFTLPKFAGMSNAILISCFIIVFLIIEWIGRDQQHALENIGGKWRQPFRWVFYYAIIISIFWLGGKEQQFIYFQF